MSLAQGAQMARGKFRPRNGTGKQPHVDVRLNKDIRAYVAAANRPGDKNQWNGKPEIPSPKEILGSSDSEEADVIDLVPNLIRSPWPDVHTYLKAHYDLLREDAVSPLRDAVAYFKESPFMGDSTSVSIYEKVFIIGMTYTYDGIALRVQFSTARSGKNIVWEYSKRLVAGSIVALTPSRDNFSTKCVVAIVAARPLEGVKATPSEVDLYFALPEDVDFDTQQEWTMIEAKSGYYESARHTLTALQKMSKESFPLSEHLCGLNPVIDAPEYVINSNANMSSLFPDQEQAEKIDIMNDWPSPPEDLLDPSQWSALRQILTKKLSIVQGPPGTGKTYVSVNALRILLDSMRPDDPPIIVAAQTNHALDQLLRHVSKFEENYVRLGGRSTDAEIKARTVFSLRKKSPIPEVPGGLFPSARKRQKLLIDSISDLISPFNRENSRAPLPASLFLELELITRAQYDSFLSGSEGWVHSGEDDMIDPVAAWLGDSLLKFEVVYKTENFGFVEDEIDLEYEQLKELEAEQGLDDDEAEGLRGPYTHLKEGFRGSSGKTLDKHAFELHMKNGDMWKIPQRARGNVYTCLQNLAKDKIRAAFQKFVRTYNALCTEIRTGKWERDMVILESARIIGMTTTGLAKYRTLVSSLKPKIIMIEEAAEVIEAPVATACVESLQHLILVGDHKQLQGHCSVQELEGDPFFLNVSMFERLVHNGIEFKSLTRQRRMAPEIRKLLAPIYDDLEDHPSVIDRPGIPGMGDVNSYFFCHSWPESSDSLMSKYNEEEAQMIVSFFLYLVLNNIPVEGITVLTFYNGQRKKILKSLKTIPILQGQYIKVHTVDSYQGEENEVVLLSLVRSSRNPARNIGFLSIENRVCVALSRAKRGFYIFGNAEALSFDPLWWQVVQIMGKNPRRLGFYLPLKCSRHGKQTFINDPSQWDFIDGGCESKCGEMRSCGHRCPILCHPTPHSDIPCNVLCGKKLACGHQCGKICAVRCQCETCGFGVHAVSEDVSRTQTPQSSHTSDSESRERQIKAYHEFANGGAAKEDARLLEAARKLALEEEKQRQDDEAYADLFGDGKAKGDDGMETRATFKRVPDGRGGWREHRTEYFQAGAPKPGKAKAQEPSLMDL
ncbi:hypothetical protein FQN54_005444 [Arachnomyces sp. PD_36]|nr:hypothetical protein FQN54_005444 [Arachnomyces sp. PD_36]